VGIDLLPLISFVLITTITPGPNNVSSAAMGVNHGFRKTLHYLLGISIGFFLVMMICAYLATALLTFVPAAERYLRWVGAVYGLMLYSTFLALLLVYTAFELSGVLELLGALVLRWTGAI